MSTYSTISQQIYSIFTNRKHRNWPLPDQKRMALVMENIEQKVSIWQPISFLQFWWGSKNINLLDQSVDLCEKATLDHLVSINQEVSNIYSPGLCFNIVPGDSRVQYANNIPKERTQIYIDSFRNLLHSYPNIFTLTPVSTLYERFSDTFWDNLKDVEIKLFDQFLRLPNFEKLAKGARNNVFFPLSVSEDEKIKMSNEAALRYCIVRSAEEKTMIYRDFSNCIRSYFVKIIPFYMPIIMSFDSPSDTQPDIDRSLLFYTWCKWNITQPWQAVWKQENGKILFLSKTRL